MSSRTFSNLGNLDRLLRALIGFGVLSLVFMGPRTPWGYLGLIPLATAIFGFCPLYSVFGISTGKPEVTR